MRRFTFVTLALTAIVAFLVGAIFAGGGTDSASVAAGPVIKSAKPVSKVDESAAAIPLINFADVVDRLNPAVVNIDATTVGRDPRSRRNRAVPETPGQLD